MSNYPNSAPTFIIPLTGQMLNNPDHITQHLQEDGEISAIIAELGFLPKGTDVSVQARLVRIDSSLATAVQNTLTINSKALSSNITLTASDVSALSLSGGTLIGPLFLSSLTDNIRITMIPYTGYNYGDICFNTSDGSDTKSLRLSGGGNISSDRGAILQLRGNDFVTSSERGAAIITAGDGGTIQLLNGSVGIGTSSPSANTVLSISHATDARFDVRSETTNNAVLRLISNNTAYASIDAMDKTFAVAKNLLLNPNGGNVGIGTTSPAFSLDVPSGNVRFGTIVGSSGNNVNIGAGAANTGIQVVNGYDLVLQPNSGNVGIGTNTPIGKLDVVSGTNQRLYVYGQGDGLGTGIVSINSANNANQPLLLDGSTLLINTQTSGKVGIGTASPTSNLHVYGSDATVAIEGSGSSTPKKWGIVSGSNGGIVGAGVLSLYNLTNSIAALNISPAGNVGIGTASPAEKLDVVGNVGMTGHIVGGDGTSNPTNLLANGDFESWSAGASAAPDGWTLAGASASVAREASTIKLGTYSTKLTRAGTNCYIKQEISAVKGITYWKGRTITLGCWVWASVAGRVRIILTDNSTWGTGSAYHPGDSAWHWITTTETVGASSIAFGAYLQVDTGDTSAYFDGAICVEGSSAFAFSPKPAEEGVWADYGIAGHYAGWLATPTGYIYTKKIGKTVHVHFSITGTSASGATTFAVPYTPAYAQDWILCRAIDNGGAATTGVVTITASSVNIGLSKNLAGDGFTTSGTKTISGQFWYEAA